MCPLCNDKGIMFNRDSKGYERMYACSCPLGDKHCYEMYAPSDKNKERAMKLPRWGVKTGVGDGKLPIVKPDSRAKASGEKDE